MRDIESYFTSVMEELDTIELEASSPEDTIKELLVEASTASIVAMFNFKHIHLHVKGKQFRELHELADSFFHRCRGTSDELFELCIEFGLRVENPLIAANKCTDCKMLNEDEYNGKEAVKVMIDVINPFLKILTKALTVADKIDGCNYKGFLESECRYWEKTKNYTLINILHDPSYATGTVTSNRL